MTHLFKVNNSKAIEVFPCRCGMVHSGDYAKEDFAHHNCFHGPLSLMDKPSDSEIQAMCLLCGEVFEIIK